jgi:PIN domain nuclease of toxin-antitoxin system
VYKAIIDTHAIIWFIFDDPRLSATAGTFLDNAINNGERIGLATISLVEITFLMEKGRIAANTLQVVLQLVADPSRGIDLCDLDSHVAQALASVPRVQVPEMADRIIAATAMRYEVPLISRDGKIQLSQVPTIW